MSVKPSGPENHAVATEHEQAVRDEAQRRVARLIWADELKQAAADRQKARDLRRQMEVIWQNGRDDNGERLRELGREHHRLTGASGGAS